MQAPVRLQVGVLAGFVAVERDFGAKRGADSLLGQHLLDANGEPRRVVGVVRSGRYRTLHDRQYNLETDRFINPGEEMLKAEI